MASSASVAIRIDESLALRSKLTRAMFSSVAAGKRNLIFFSRQKSRRWALGGGAKEGVFHFGPLFLQMSSSCESILDHIAGYLKFISKAQSFWFTLNTSYNHGCHLASRFHLEPNDYEVLLVAAGLALYTWLGFAIKPTAWRKFLGGHRFAVDDCAIEFEQKKIDIDAYIDGARPSRSNRGGFYVVRIGNKTSNRQTELRTRGVMTGD
jgi:hypothetical protein